MNSITYFSSVIRDKLVSARQHLIKRGPIYLIAVSILTSAGIALYVHTHEEQPFAVRVGGGRTFATDDLLEDGLQRSVMQIRDLTPRYVKKLAEYIGGRLYTPENRIEDLDI